MTRPTYAEIASSFELWQEFVDANGVTTRQEFDAMTTTDRIAAQIEAFGPEPSPVPTVEQIMAGTHVANGFHDWPVDGGMIRVGQEELRIALEAAYDRTCPDWPVTVDI